MRFGHSYRVSVRNLFSLKNGTQIYLVLEASETLNDEYWAELLAVRSEVNKVLEQVSYR